MGSETQTIVNETVAPAPEAIITLFELNLTRLGGPTLYFYSGVNSDYTTVTFNTVTYNAFPVVAQGFDLKAKGELPRPVLTFSNVGNYIGSLADTYGDLVGGQIIRRRTYVSCLGGTDQPQFIPDVFYIDRMTERNKALIRFELGSSLDVEDLQLPLRQVSPSYCPWLYRGEECGYNQDFCVAEADNTPLFASAAGIDYVGVLADESAVQHSFNDLVFIPSQGGYFRCYYSTSVRDPGYVYPVTYAIRGNIYFFRGTYDASLVYYFNNIVWYIDPDRADDLTYGISKYVCKKDQVLNKQPNLNPNDWKEISSWRRVPHPNAYDSSIRYRRLDRVYVETNGVKVYYICKQDMPKLGSDTTIPSPTTDTLGTWWAKEQEARGEWALSTVFAKGDTTYIAGYPPTIFVGGINTTTVRTYYMCILGHTASVNNKPPNSTYWKVDQCSHSVAGCKLRFDPDNKRISALPFGGFPGTLYIPNLT